LPIDHGGMLLLNGCAHPRPSDPDRVLAAYKAGATFDQLQKDTYAGIYPPLKPPNLHLPAVG
jgi:hypothetical protein